MQGYAFSLLSGICFGLTVAIGKMVSSSIPPLEYIFLLSVVALVVSWLMWVVRGNLKIPLVDRAILKPFLGHAVSLFIAGWAFWEGASRMEGGVANLYVRLELVFVLAISWWYFKERLRREALIGAMLIIVGTSLMALGASRDGIANFPGIMSTGALFIFVSGAAFAAAEGFAKVISPAIDPRVLVIWRSLMFVVVYSIATIAFGVWVPPSASDLVLIALASLCGPVLAHMFLVMALKRNDLGRTLLLVQVEPVVTAVAAYFLLGEVAVAHEWRGAVLILVGCGLLHW